MSAIRVCKRCGKTITDNSKSKYCIDCRSTIWELCINGVQTIESFFDLFSLSVENKITNNSDKKQIKAQKNIQKMEKAINAGQIPSERCFKKASLEQLNSERERVRSSFLSQGADSHTVATYEGLLNKFDKEIYMKKTGKEYNANEISYNIPPREHGWNLYRDDD